MRHSFYVPSGLSVTAANELRMSDPERYKQLAMDSMSKHVRAMLDFQQAGAEVFDYGNNLRQQAYNNGVSNAFEFPGFVPAYIRPLFCEGKGPFRWVALSGDEEDIYATDEAILELFPEDDHLRRWLKMAREKVPFQGLPARICWLGYGERVKAGLRFNELVASGKVKAPIVIGRDHLRFWFRRFPQSRNRIDEGRLGRHLRLGDPQCDDQRGRRRDLGLIPSWRRCWDGIQPARRAGDRGRRDTGGRCPTYAGADYRSRHGGRSSCRCGLRDRHRNCEAAWHQNADAEINNNRRTMVRLLL